MQEEKNLCPHGDSNPGSSSLEPSHCNNLVTIPGLSSITNSMRNIPSGEANNSSAVKMFPAIYGTRRPIIAFKRQLVSCQCHQTDQFSSCSLPSYLLQICFNVILSSKPRSPKCFLSHSFPHQNPTSTSPPPHTCPLLCQLHSYWLFNQIMDSKSKPKLKPLSVGTSQQF